MNGYAILAGVIVLFHLAFILFVLLGGLFSFRWKKMIWVHIPIALWGIIVEYFNIVCPLTPLENYFRRRAGSQAYSKDFIEQYIIPLIYPEELGHNLQLILGSTVILLNLFIYVFVYLKYRKKN